MRFFLLKTTSHSGNLRKLVIALPFLLLSVMTSSFKCKKPNPCLVSDTTDMLKLRELWQHTYNTDLKVIDNDSCIAITGWVSKCLGDIGTQSDGDWEFDLKLDTIPDSLSCQRLIAHMVDSSSRNIDIGRCNSEHVLKVEVICYDHMDGDRIACQGFDNNISDLPKPGDEGKRITVIGSFIKDGHGYLEIHPLVKVIWHSEK